MAYWRHTETKQVRKSDKKPGDKWTRIKGGKAPVADAPVDPKPHVAGPATTDNDPQTAA